MLRNIGIGRVAGTLLFVLLGVLVARYSWYLPFIGQAERAFYDLRMTATAAHVEQDDRIVMIVYTDDTLIDTKKRSPLDRATLARALANIDALEAKAIGIDILIDQPQDEDQQLLAVFAGLKTPTFLAYADINTNADNIEYRQQQFLDQFMARLKGTKVSPASIRLEVDGDGVARSWPAQPSNLPPLLATAMAGNSAFQGYMGSIRYRLPLSEDRPVIASFPIDLFANPDTAAAFADQVKGRHVLIGGDIVDLDQFETPMTAITGDRMIGLEVHANILAQYLDGDRPEQMPGVALWMAALLAAAASILTSLLEGKNWKIALFILLQLAFFVALPFYLQAHGTDTQFLPASGWALGWFITYAVVGSAARAVGSEQRKFAQSALGKYLPRDIAQEILNDPERLALHGEKRDIFVVFTDLEGFTKLSHAIEPEMVASLLNRYLDMLSDVVLEYGGTIDKFVGDAVVAFWGAPISRPDDGERAARAAYAMWQAGEAFRADIPDGVPPIGRTRVGLHFGEAIVGNFGGEGRIQYTALGDSMNTAARLEAANKQLGSSVIASREAVERSSLGWWRPMGRVVLRGRATPVDIFEPRPDLDISDLDHIRAMMNQLSTNRSGAVTELSAYAERHVDDAALANLLYRLEHGEAGGEYVLD
ncbi:adenylate/guanylate cyclase domain-containing protein [Rhizorhapis suberifaciens]|uniref:Adenylate cyclase n=1 Tax=Rhizorhapis suberifaciens TaxID=13656 RepID=A0A840HW74_9SPHN|nr:adenylate/guanylate cyclase domain-containing protein [Rhizorhapis suberifaciens]MBB4641830.1 adenylate cyclase [Rhizorhapis suberifaciens]